MQRQADKVQRKDLSIAERVTDIETAMAFPRNFESVNPKDPSNFSLEDGQNRRHANRNSKSNKRIFDYSSGTKTSGTSDSGVSDSQPSEETQSGR